MTSQCGEAFYVAVFSKIKYKYGKQWAGTRIQQAISNGGDKLGRSLCCDCLSSWSRGVCSGLNKAMCYLQCGLSLCSQRFAVPLWNNSSLNRANVEQLTNNEQTVRGSWVVLILIQNPRQLVSQQKIKSLWSCWYIVTRRATIHHPGNWIQIFGKLLD